MVITQQVIESFYPDHEEVRAFALEHDFSQGTEMHGHVYPGTVKPKHEGFTEFFKVLLKQALNANIDLKGTAFVSAREGEFTEQWIHSDSICAQAAAVIYLFDGHHEHGTALWRHREANCTMQDQEFYHALGVDVRDEAQVEALVQRIRKEGETEEAWQLAGFTEARMNRMIVYPAKAFHSRYPRHAFGDSAETSRLVQVAFFDIL